MKVSIITSCFNRENTIREAIESILSQSYIDIEYIVIDGASSDNSLNIIKEYKNDITAIISEPDNGIYEGINKGIRHATGDIIGLLHSDDLLYSKDTIAHIVAAFNENNADIVYGDGLFVNEQNSRVVRNWISGTYSKKKMKRGWLPLHPTVYIKKEYFDRLGYYDESFKISADSEFLVRYFYENNLNIHYLNEYIVRMRMWGASTKLSKNKQKWEEDFRLYKQHNFNPYISLMGKILSKIPQFINRP
ncbi:MAG: glycosyltransferase [Parabacteroides sp.]|nr:glycosyltransferase [Parabacteroides sp.]